MWKAAFAQTYFASKILAVFFVNLLLRMKRPFPTFLLKNKSTGLFPIHVDFFFSDRYIIGLLDKIWKNRSTKKIIPKISIWGKM